MRATCYIFIITILLIACKKEDPVPASTFPSLDGLKFAEVGKII